MAPVGARPLSAHHHEHHRRECVGWLRAAVLGSDDAIVSIASLMIGVAAASASREATLIAGVAGLAAGAMSMAVGEYVSVSSQRDAERADVAREERELAAHPEAELHELARIYVKRGLDEDLALRVAQQLTAHDHLGAHLRDELGIEVGTLSRPILAALVSSAGFACFAMVPMVALLVAPASARIPVMAAASLLSLPGLGALGGWLGGAPIGRAALRVTLGGALAMAVTAGIGRILGVAAG